MSDDWDRYRSGSGGEGNEPTKDDAGTRSEEPGRDDPGGWPQEPETRPRAGGRPPSSTWQRPDYGDRRATGTPRARRALSTTTTAEPEPYRRPAQPRPARPPLPGPPTQRPGHARLDPHHRRRDPDRARAQAVGRQPVPHPVVVDGADAELRERPRESRLSRQLERPRARLPHLPRLRPDPSRGDIVVFNTPSEAATKCGEGGTFVKRVIGLPGDTVHEDKQWLHLDPRAPARRLS